MAETIGEREIEIAAGWWARAVERPKHDALGSTRDTAMEFAQAAADLRTVPAAPAATEQFASHLRAELRIATHGLSFFNMGVDYGPDKILEDCGRASGITDFPWKTMMWLRPGYVAVRHGYGAPIDVLLGVRCDFCGSTKHDLAACDLNGAESYREERRAPFFAMREDKADG